MNIMAGKDPTTISHGNIRSTQSKNTKLCQRAAAYNGLKHHSSKSINFFNTESLGKVNEVSLMRTATP